LNLFLLAPRFSLRLLIQASFILLTSFAMPLQAAESFVVKDIRVEGLQRVEPGTVFSYLPIQVGETFTQAKGAESIKALYSTGSKKDLPSKVVK
jgi:outer membrane protein insertion porin family